VTCESRRRRFAASQIVLPVSRDGEGLVVYQLEHAFRDGTTHVLFGRSTSLPGWRPWWRGTD
jgi:hypothetical protein